MENIDRLVLEVFTLDEQTIAELRLNKSEVEYLINKYQATCRLMDEENSDNQKSWYIVEIHDL